MKKFCDDGVLCVNSLLQRDLNAAIETEEPLGTDPLTTHDFVFQINDLSHLRQLATALER